MLTLEDRPRTYATITRFPDGDVKVSGCHRPPPSSRAKPKTKTSEIERQLIAARRATTHVLDYAKYYALSYLHTLTYRGPVTDRMKVQKDLKRWLRLIRETLPEFFCLAVFELHKGGGANDGGIHVHLATDRFYPVSVLRAAWWRVVGEAQGNIQIEHRAFADSARRVGAYLAKYVAKDFDSAPRSFGQHRYLRSSSLRVPRERLVYFRGHFRFHRYAAMCIVSIEAGRLEKSWISEDELRFSFRSYG